MQTLTKIWGTIVLIRTAFRGYEKPFLITTVAGTLSGILGGLGIGILIPLFAYFTGATTGGGKITVFVNSVFSTFGISPHPLYLLSCMMLLFIAKAAIMFWTSYYSEQVAEAYEENSRKTIFAGLLRSEWGYLLEQKTGYLERVLMSEANYAGQILYETSMLILLLTSLLIYLAAAFVISAGTTLIVLLLGAVLFFFLRNFYSQIQKLAQEVLEAEKEAAHYITEHLSGVKTVKALGAEDGASLSAFGEFQKITVSRMHILFYKLLSSSFFEPISFLFIGLIFLYSYHTAGFELGSFIAIIYLIQKIFGFLQSLQSKLQVIQTYVPSLRSIARYKDIVAKTAEKQTGTLPFSFTDSLSFNNVGFGYGDTTLFENVHFTIKKGSLTALIGPSGAGKTTVADLALRLFGPSKGNIEIDGVDVSTIDLRAWRKNIGYVSQDIFLLNETIENNIRFYDASITDAALKHAAALANILETIEALPRGFASIVGERGVKLSGGQRQRIVLARILARNPELLILDEATSALDNESEALIQKTLDSIRGTVTILVIAHRLSTIQHADHIIALDKGVVAESGTPQELMKKKDSYYNKMLGLSSREK